MTKDRLKDLGKQEPTRPDVLYSRLAQDDPNASTKKDSDSTTIQLDHTSLVTDFLKQIDAVRVQVDQIDELAHKVQRIQMEMLQPMASPKLGEELDDKKAKIKNLAIDVSIKLKKMEQAKENREQLGISQTQWRIKESQLFVLTRRFRDTMVQYNQEIDLHRERCKKAIVHEMEIAGIRKSNDELEEMLESGYTGAFSFCILIECQKAKQSLDLIEARRRDIIKLENSVRELHDMFVDLARLVADQGAMIDSIEHNVAKAVDFVEDAREQVIVAEGYQKKANKKKVFTLLVVITIVVVLLFILSVAYFTQKKLAS